MTDKQAQRALVRVALVATFMGLISLPFEPPPPVGGPSAGLFIFAALTMAGAVIAGMRARG